MPKADASRRSSAAGSPVSARLSPTVWALVAVILGGFFVGYIYVTKVAWPDMKAEESVLPKKARLERDFEATRSDGEKVSLGQLQGKVMIVAPLRVGGDDTGRRLVTGMKKLADIFAGDDRVYLINIAVDPKTDTPEKLAAFAKELGADRPHWWFLSGDEEQSRAYMIKMLQFLPVHKKKPELQRGPDDTLAWDARLVLVDQGGHVRRYRDPYDLLLADPDLQAEALKLVEKDVRRILDEKAGK